MQIGFLIHVLLLFNVARGFFRLMPRKKVQRELFTKKKNGEMQTKRAHDNLRISKLQEVVATRDSLFPLFCFVQEKTFKNFPKKPYKLTSKIKKKEEAETKSSDWA